MYEISPKTYIGAVRYLQIFYIANLYFLKYEKIVYSM